MLTLQVELTRINSFAGGGTYNQSAPIRVGGNTRWIVIPPASLRMRARYHYIPAHLWLWPPTDMLISAG